MMMSRSQAPITRLFSKSPEDLSLAKPAHLKASPESRTVDSERFSTRFAFPRQPSEGFGKGGCQFLVPPFRSCLKDQ